MHRHRLVFQDLSGETCEVCCPLPVDLVGNSTRQVLDLRCPKCWVFLLMMPNGWGGDVTEQQQGLRSLQLQSPVAKQAQPIVLSYIYSTSCDCPARCLVQAAPPAVGRAAHLFAWMKLLYTLGDWVRIWDCNGIACR